ncbi:MAG TPA: aminoglycoside phosphotransferase family protein [Pyrinomonadaceae bacterium]|nr:aminoglycoside phosphotransferase family protein [Pyrinomonadaceae bacterium]
MTKREYSYPFPAELVTHVTAICGDRGRAWLDELPSTIDELEQRWSLQVDAPFPAGEYNFVAPAVTSDGQLTVIKIAPPFETNEIIGEAAFLRHRAGRGAVKLLEEDIERRAILIERLLPGKNLAELFTGNEELAVEPAIDVLRSILGPPPNDSVTSLDDWFKVLHRHIGTDFPASYAEKALDFYETLSKQPGRRFYLHGDYHPGNVVNATRSPFLAIDSKGIVGHVGYDIAVFLNNFHWWQEKRSDIRERLERPVAQFAEAFELDPLEVRQWAFTQMVLSAWWSFDEMPQFYDNIVAKADIWDV